MKNKGIISSYLKTAKRITVEDGKIILDPNSWEDAEWWYEDNDEVYNFMMNNQQKIIQYSKESNKSIKESIDCLFAKKDT